MKIRSWLAAVLVSLPLGMAVGWQLKPAAPVAPQSQARAPAPSKTSLACNHQISETGHAKCKRLTIQDAMRIVENELRSPTLDIVKRKVTQPGPADFTSNKEETSFGFQLYCYLGGNEQHLWTFEVDHMDGRILQAWPLEPMPRSKALAIARNVFVERKEPELKNHWPASEARIELRNSYYQRFPEEWYFTFSASGQDGTWNVVIDADGKVVLVYLTMA